MAEETGIAWTRSTFNPWIGCTRVSPGCDHCYAEALDKRHRWGLKKGEGPVGVAPHWGPGAPRHRTSPETWQAPISWNGSAKREQETGLPSSPKSTWTGRVGFWPVFCASLADVFDNEVPADWRIDLGVLIRATPHLTWLLLTKRIGNAAKFPVLTQDRHGVPLPNVWLGASVVNQEEADRDIPKLLATPAAKRFVSYEPALGPIDFHFERGWCPHCKIMTSGRIDGHCMDQSSPCFAGELAMGDALNWVIVGGESSQGSAEARPFDADWAGYTVKQCKDAGVACFVKQLGSAACTFEATGDFRTHQGKRQIKLVGTRIPLKNRHGADPAEWPEQLRVQEFPR